MPRSRNSSCCGAYLSAATCKQMVLKAIRDLRQPNGSDYRSILCYIRSCYKVKKSFPLKQIIDWLVEKRVLGRKKKKIWIIKQKNSQKLRKQKKKRRHQRPCNPRISQRSTRCLQQRKQKKKKPKFRNMIINAIRAIGEPSRDRIEQYISRHYKVCNSFVTKQTLQWLEGKEVIRCRRGRYSLTGKPLTLYVGCCEAAAQKTKKRRRAPSCGRY